MQLVYDVMSATASVKKKHGKHLHNAGVPAARLARCLRLVNLLQSRIGYSVDKLALELEVSPRTIYRDLRLLASAGVSACYDANKRGHVLQHHIHIRPSALSEDEIIALMLAAHVFSLSCVRTVGSLIHQATGKIMAQMPQGLQEDIAGMLSSIGGKPAKTLWPKGSQIVIAEILNALQKKRPIRIAYRSGENNLPPLFTKITFQRLVAARGQWFLVGRSSWHRKVVRFDVRHIFHAEQTEDSADSAQPSLCEAVPRNRLLTGITHG